MFITEVKIHLPRQQPTGKFLCYANIVLDSSLVIRGIRLIRVQNDRILVAFPSERAHGVCCACEGRVDHFDRFCRHCGNQFTSQAAMERCHHDVVHPINPAFRQYVEQVIVDAYFELIRKAAGA